MVIDFSDLKKIVKEESVPATELVGNLTAMVDINALQADGKIVASGYTPLTVPDPAVGRNHIVLLRLNDDGIPATQQATR
mgnify:CR=1 FL=1